jgi:hypothetical protein
VNSNQVPSHALLVNDRSKITALNNQATITAIDGGNAIYVSNANSEITSLNNEAGAIISAVNQGHGINTEGLIGTLTNRGTISGAISGIGVDDYNDYDYGPSPTGRINTLINLGTLSGGVFDIDAVARDLSVDDAPIGTLTNAQSGLTYRGTLPELYQVVITSTTDYGSLDAVPENGSLMAFAIDAGHSTVTNDFLYEGVLKGIPAQQLAATSGSSAGVQWQLVADEDDPTQWSLCVGNCQAGGSDNGASFEAVPVPFGTPGWLLMLTALLGGLGVRTLRSPVAARRQL